MGDFDDLAAAFDDSIGSDYKCPVHLRDLLDILADFGIVQVSDFTLVTAERIKTAILAMLENLPRIADDKQRADFFPFAPLAANLRGEIDDGLQALERNAAFQPL